MKLEELIKEKKAKVSVVGLGYVGLPTAVEIAKAGYQVFGIDIKKQKIDQINKGISYISDISSENLKKIVDSEKLKAFNTYESLKKSDIILICIPTPLDKNKIPDLVYVKAVAEKIAQNLRKEQLIILESSTYPGTTKEVILPLLRETGLKEGKDFFLAYSPERIDPGNKKYKFKDISRVAGGTTKECVNLAVKFYQSFIKAQIFPLSSCEAAEMTKVLENTFRLVNISMINELALLCDKMKIDIWEVIEAAKTKPYGFQAFYPSPKVGGHCIPLDPFYLSWKAKEYNFWAKFIDLAGEINEQMPHFVMTKINYVLNKQEKPVRGSKFLVWGVAYKKDINDYRESAACNIIWDLLRKGAEVDYFDPYVKKFELKNHRFKNDILLESIEYSPKILKNYDCVVILTDHSGFDYNEVAENSKLIIDTRNAIKSRNYKNIYRFGD
ncbi:nucleotide sugar dehydrogenase [Candidatus Parcubacteria bacterium]|nr:nucleotide sugar dehydrogenase [Candidatus Parcubacteria bacterium]